MYKNTMNVSYPYLSMLCKLNHILDLNKILVELDFQEDLRFHTSEFIPLSSKNKLSHQNSK